MADITALIDSALRSAGVPILGVTLGAVNDRATWRVDFDPSATDAQRAQAATLLSTVVVDATALAAQDDKNAQAAIDAMRLDLKAVVLTLVDKLNDINGNLVALLAAVNALNTKAGLVQTTLPNPTPQAAPAQALNAIRAKAGTL